VTGVTVRGNRAERAAGMALGAGQPGVPRRQRKRCMLIRGWQPRCRAVALLAGVRERLSRMVGRPLIVRRVTGVAGRGDRAKRAARMTLGTIQTRMSSRERERCMLIRGRQPCRCAVALLAGVRERLSRMIGSPLVIRRVTCIAVGWNGPKCTAGMALSTVEAGVSADKGEEIVHNLGPLPRDGSMTTVAVGGPSARRMIGRGRPHQVRPVAQVTRGRCATELAGRRSRMAAFAGRRYMGPE
jgi:hypothetical protein